MNWQHLIYFKKVAEYEHLTRAAEELFISPSALSKAIASLEDEIGIPLFEKNGRNIQLNHFGRSFYDYVSKAMSEINIGIHHIQQSADVYAGTIRLCSIFSPGTNYLPELLSLFNKEYPDVHIDLSQNMTQHILNKLLANELDIGICSEFSQENEYAGIERALLYQEEIYLAVSKLHPLAQLEEITLATIKDEVFINYTNNTGIAATLHRAFCEAFGPDYQLKVRFSANEPNTITHLISKNLGIGFVIENPSLYTTNVKILKIKDFHFYHTIYMVWKKDAYMPPVASLFKDYALSHRYLRTPDIRPAAEINNT